MEPTPFNIFPPLNFSLSLSLYISSCPPIVPTSYYLTCQTSPSSSPYIILPTQLAHLLLTQRAHLLPSLPHPSSHPSISSFSFPPVVPTSYNLSLPPTVPSSLSLSHAYSSSPSTPAPTFLPRSLLTHLPPTHHPPCILTPPCSRAPQIVRTQIDPRTPGRGVGRKRRRETL